MTAPAAPCAAAAWCARLAGGPPSLPCLALCAAAVSLLRAERVGVPGVAGSRMLGSQRCPALPRRAALWALVPHPHHAARWQDLGGRWRQEERADGVSGLRSRQAAQRHRLPGGMGGGGPGGCMPSARPRPGRRPEALPRHIPPSLHYLPLPACLQLLLVCEAGQAGRVRQPDVRTSMAEGEAAASQCAGWGSRQLAPRWPAGPATRACSADGTRAAACWPSPVPAPPLNCPSTPLPITGAAT